MLSLLPSLLVALLQPTPGELLLDIEVREAFVHRWEPVHASVLYRQRDDSGLADTTASPRSRCRGFVATGPGAEPVVWAPMALLDRAADIEVTFSDGRRSAARAVALRPDLRPIDVPLVALRLADPTALEGRPVLRWADPPRKDDDEVEPTPVDTRAWMLERPGFRGPDGAWARPVLVDTVVSGPEVHPLERFRVVTLRWAAGHPLLDADGRVVCAVFRPRAGAEDEQSLCAPPEAAHAPYVAP